ncbi:hypothetical protein HY798_05000 [Candidatus Falkowbacteria bacterium]|nr:hypothetical protein [Candidatus Falkowbacteria bacterium]
MEWETTSASGLELLYDKIYPAFGLPLGAHLVEANVVLTLAGARGYTEFFVRRSDYGSQEEVCKINSAIRSLGVQLTHLNDMKFINGRDATVVLSKIAIESLAGYPAVFSEICQEVTFLKRISSNEKIDWPDKVKNVERLHLAIKRAQAVGEIDKDYNSSNILLGLILGYPFVAILDVEEDSCRRFLPSQFPACPYGKFLERQDDHRLISSDIPEVLLYGGDLPDFFFSKAHRDHPKIKAKIECWREILADFYGSDWHKKISRDRDFMKARQAIEVWRNDILAE